MLFNILAVVVVIVVALLIFASTRPNTLHVTRSAVVNARADEIFPLLNDFHRWGSWSPWERLDPDLKRQYSGAESGVGAIYNWEGNKKVGAGRMEITDSAAPSRVVIKLDFLKPFEAHNTTEFGLEPKGLATNVTWTMRGPNSLMSKVMGLFMNMDRLIGTDFEKGLANLKEVTEK